MSEREATHLGLPDLVRPMLAVPGELPAASEDGRWAYELKWDGVRAIGYVQDGTTRLLSRNDLDVSISYPEVLEPPAPVRQRGLVLDGELVALDERGRPSIGGLQERMHVRDQAAVRRLTGRVPVFYYVFDLLRLDDRPLLQLPYSERRALLDDLELDTTTWRGAPSFPRPPQDGMGARPQPGPRGRGGQGPPPPLPPGQRA